MLSRIRRHREEEVALTPRSEKVVQLARLEQFPKRLAHLAPAD
jgi:hypothetical protein